MLKKKQRFTRDSFPTKKPLSRQNFPWGTVSLFEGTPGVAVVVSKKVIKKAHDRNRAKRRVYALFETITPSKGVVVHVRREALTAPHADMQKDLESVLK